MSNGGHATDAKLSSSVRLLQCSSCSSRPWQHHIHTMKGAESNHLIWIIWIVSLWITPTCQWGAETVEVSDKPQLRMSVLLRYNLEDRRLLGNIEFQLKQGQYEDWSFNENYTYSKRFAQLYLRTYSPPEIMQAICENVIGEKASSALFFIQDEKEADTHSYAEQYILGVTSYLGIPILAYSGTVQPSSHTSIIQLTPSIRHQCRAMLALLRNYSWHQFAIVTGSLPGNTYFIDTLKELTDADDWFDLLAVVRIDSTDEGLIATELQKLRETRIILLYASRAHAETLFKVATQEGMTKAEFQWIVSQTVVGSDEGPKEELPPGLLGLYFDQTSSTKTELVKSVADIWMTGINNLYIDKQSNSSLADVTFRPDYSCITVNGKRNTEMANQCWNYGHLLFEYMKNYNGTFKMRFNSDGTLTDAKITIKNLNMDREWKAVGFWKTPGTLYIEDITWPEDKKTPPVGRPSKYHIKIITLKEEPYVVYSKPDPKLGTCPPQAVSCKIVNETKHYIDQCCSGFNIDLLKKLSNSIGFDYELFEVEDKLWGSHDEETKEWNGLVKAVMDGKADMVMTSLKITPERNTMIDFSIPYLETGITIIVAVRDGVISPTAFLEPYDYPSWCLILVFSVHASGAAIFIFEWLSPSGLDRGNKPLRETSRSEHRFSLFRSFWLIWSMLFGAAVNVDNPRGVSSRFLGNIWALFAVVFTASYTANLAAFMITKEDYDRLSGIQDWRLRYPEKHKPPFKFATIPHGSTDTNIRNNFPSMYKWMQQFNKSGVSEGVRAVKEGEINAFIYDATVLEYRASHDEGCKLRTVGSWYAMTGYGVGFPKGSKWIDVVNKRLAEYQYDGSMERLQRYWLAGACKKGEEEQEQSMPLGILNFTSAFILLAGGMLLGGVLLILEHVYFKFFRAKLRKWDKCGCCALVSLSMGKSLTFEQSVREAIELQRHFKCKNPICETQVWKLKHELDLALLRVERLQKEIGGTGSQERRALWKGGAQLKPSGALPSVAWKQDRQPMAVVRGEPAHYSEHDPRYSDQPPTTQVKLDIYNEWGDDKDNSGRAVVAHPDLVHSDFQQPTVAPPSYTELSAAAPFTVDSANSDTPFALPSSSSGSGTTRPADKYSKSLPVSPIKRPVVGPSSVLYSTDLTSYQTSPPQTDPNGPIAGQRGQGQGHDSSSKTKGLKSRKTKLLDRATVEKETVL